MKKGHIERDDAQTLMDIYKKITPAGFLAKPLTIHEQVLIFAMAKSIEDGITPSLEDNT